MENICMWPAEVFKRIISQDGSEQYVTTKRFRGPCNPGGRTFPAKEGVICRRALGNCPALGQAVANEDANLEEMHRRATVPQTAFGAMVDGVGSKRWGNPESRPVPGEEKKSD